MGPIFHRRSDDTSSKRDAGVRTAQGHELRDRGSGTSKAHVPLAGVESSLVGGYLVVVLATCSEGAAGTSPRWHMCHVPGDGGTCSAPRPRCAWGLMRPTRTAHGLLSSGAWLLRSRRRTEDRDAASWLGSRG